MHTAAPGQSMSMRIIDSERGARGTKIEACAT